MLLSHGQNTALLSHLEIEDNTTENSLILKSQRLKGLGQAYLMWLWSIKTLQPCGHQCSNNTDERLSLQSSYALKHCTISPQSSLRDMSFNAYLEDWGRHQSSCLSRCCLFSLPYYSQDLLMHQGLRIQWLQMVQFSINLVNYLLWKKYLIILYIKMFASNDIFWLTYILANN